jgi:hypothetical protein
MPRLEKWGAIKDDYDVYLAPELRSWLLTGEVLDSSKFPDGHRVITSPIVEFTVEEDLVRAKTRSGTLYVLGQPDPEFIKVLEAKGQTMSQALDTLKKIAGMQGSAKQLN